MAEILVMEDDQNFAELLVASLEHAGHQVFWFMDASSALLHLEQHRVDLVITDLSVKKDGRAVSDGGIKLISQLRRMKRSYAKVMPIIAITGSHVYHGMSDVLNIATQVGANATLKKPFDPDELLMQIDRLL